MKSRTQGSRPRPKIQKNPRSRPRTALPRTDPLEAKDRNARGQGQGPRTQAQVFSQKKVFKKFSGDLQQKRLPKFFFRRPTKFQQFKKRCCPRAEDRATFEDLRPRGQGQGLDLRGQGQGQGLQNVSSKTSSRPRISSRTPPLVLSTEKEADSGAAAHSASSS